MGQATIVGGGTDGRYTIEIDSGEWRRQQLVAAANENLAKVQAAVNALTVEVAEKQAANDAGLIALNVAQEAYIAAVNAYGPTDIRTGQAFLEHQELLSKQTNLLALLQDAKTRLAEGKLMLTAAQKRANRWNSLNVIQTRQAWCADLTEDATGAVATIEIPGESDLILLKPGAPRPTAADGYLFSRDLMSPEQAYYNCAILPGWQKYKPTFRRGTVSSINKTLHTCNVTLPEAYSSAQRLPVNQESTLIDVPITYMDCASDVFESGDNVIVQFDGQNWESPRVIGFVTDPRRCLTHHLVQTIFNWNADYPSVLFGTTFFCTSVAYATQTVSQITTNLARGFYKRNGGSWVELNAYGSRFSDRRENGYINISVSPNSEIDGYASTSVTMQTVDPYIAWSLLAVNDVVEVIIVAQGRVRFNAACSLRQAAPCLVNMTGGFRWDLTGRTIEDSYAHFRGEYDPINGGPVFDHEVSRLDYPIRMENTSYSP